MVRPVPIEEALALRMDDENPKWTICQVLRTTYKLAEGIADRKLKDEIQLKIREANVLANRMSNKLRDYKNDYDKDWWAVKEGVVD